MSLSKISRGNQIILGSGILLFILSFFNWNNASVAGVSGTFDSAWSHGVGPLYGILLILTLGVAVLLVLVAQSVIQVKLPELPISNSMVVAGLAALTVIFGLIRFLTHKSGLGVVSVGRTWAAWVSLVLLIVMAAGAFFLFQEAGGKSAIKGAEAK